MTRSILVRVLLVATIFLLAAAGAACAKRHHIAIESNTCWILIVDHQRNAVINDCSNSNYRVAGDVKCVAVTNLTDIGFVRVRIDDGAWSESSAPRGTAEACR